MNSYWSWIFILQVLLSQGAFVVHAFNNDGDDSEYNVLIEDSSESSQTDRSNLVLTIVGGVFGGLCLILLLIFLFVRYGRAKVPQLEDGIQSPKSSSRHWFARFGRYRRDEKDQYAYEKDVDMMNEKVLLSMPRYMRANSAFAREMPQTSSPAGFNDHPLPRAPSPAVPRTAHVAPSKPTMFAGPNSAPLVRPESIRSIERLKRQPQISPRPMGGRQMVPSPLGNGSRKRDILPNFFRFGGKQSQPVLDRQGIRLPPGLAEASPDELARRMLEKKRAVAVLEAKSRVHKHHAHSGSVSSVSSISTTASCDVDAKLQKDLAELRQEVQVLNTLLPNGPPPSYNNAF